MEDYSDKVSSLELAIDFSENGIGLKSYLSKRYEYLIEKLDVIRQSRSILDYVYKFPSYYVDQLLAESKNISINDIKLYGRLDLNLDDNWDIWSSEYNERTVGPYEYRYVDPAYPDGSIEFIKYMHSFSSYAKIGVWTYPYISEDPNIVPNEEVKFFIDHLYSEYCVPVTPYNYYVEDDHLVVNYKDMLHHVDVLWKYVGVSSICSLFYKEFKPIMDLYNAGSGSIKIFNPLCEDILGLKYFALFDDFYNQPVSFLYDSRYKDILAMTDKYVVKGVNSGSGKDVHFCPLNIGDFDTSSMEFIIQTKKVIRPLPLTNGKMVQCSFDPYFFDGKLQAILCRGSKHVDSYIKDLKMSISDDNNILYRYNYRNLF